LGIATLQWFTASVLFEAKKQAKPLTLNAFVLFPPAEWICVL
jgi:hypothetical protein